MRSLSPKALRRWLDLDDLVAEALAGGDLDLQRLVGPVGLLGLLQQLLVGVEAGLALGLAGFGSHAHPLQLAGQGAAAAVVGALLLLEPDLLLLQPRAVVALEGQALAPLQLEDPLGHVVEEVAVVGDGHDGALVLGQGLLQPGHRLGVEVVGGLVEQEQVGLRQQQPAEGHAALLAAREGVDGGVTRRGAERVHGDVDGALEVPGPGGLDLGLEVGLLGAELVEVGVGVGPAGQDLVVVVEQRRDLAHAVQHVAGDVLGLVEVGLLFEEADREAGGQAGLAGVVVVEPGHDPQQGGLARPVGADHPDLGAGVEAQVDVLEHLAGRRVEAPDLVHRVDELRSHVGDAG